MKSTTAPRYVSHNLFRIALIAVALVQIGVLMKSIYDRQSLLNTGREIVTAVEPVDPRDLFRGDYVILGYAFSRVRATDLAAASTFEEFKAGDKVFVTLKKGEEQTWTPTAVGKMQPATSSSDGAVMLRGIVRSRWLGENNIPELNVTYGTERYYVPEGTGRALEEKVRDESVQAILAIAPDGTAAIKGVIVGGERHVDPPLF
jgi:uncharacterized membrane-anchored protein